MKFQAVFVTIFVGVAFAVPAQVLEGRQTAPAPAPTLAVPTTAAPVPAPSAPVPAAPVPAINLTPGSVCSGTYNNALCCATDVLGVAGLDCANPSTVPTNTTVFVDTCSAVGQQARCCVFPILEQGLLCNEPIGA